MQSHAATEPVIRPKVMRRPAQFAGGRATSVAVAEEVAPVQLPTLYHPPVRYWQEDARFGLALVGVVVAINLILMLCLPLLHTPNAARGATIATTEPTLPATNETAHGAVTIYTQPFGTPTAAELTAHSNPGPWLGTTPDEMPIPRAKPLDSSEE